MQIVTRFTATAIGRLTLSAFAIGAMGCGDEAPPIEDTAPDVVAQGDVSDVSGTDGTADSGDVGDAIDDGDAADRRDTVGPDDGGDTSDERDTSAPGDTADTTDTNTCTATCASAGTRRCNGDTVEVCVDSDGCLMWATETVCDAPRVCRDGACGEDDTLVPAFVSYARGQLDVQLDASRSRGGVGTLEARWDIGADGSFEHDWDDVLTAIHTFDAVGTYAVTLEIRDDEGALASITRDVTVHALQTVSGNLPAGDVHWAGTIVLTGPVETHPNTRLEIAPGTSVLAAWVDGDGDGVGDAGIFFNGPTSIVGTAEEPIHFGAYNDTDEAKQWQGIAFGESGDNRLEWVIVENGTTCVDIYNPTTIIDVETRHCETGVRVDSWGESSISRLHAHANTYGLRRNGGRLTTTDSRVMSNRYGVWVENSDAMLVTRSEIRGNDPTGIYMTTNRFGARPDATFQLNNIHDSLVLIAPAGDRPDFRFNFWGEDRGYPNVAVPSPTRINFEGFVGVPFDATWSRGPFVGGETLTGDTTWSGTVHLNGNITIPVGSTLTIQPGTLIVAAPIDVDGQPFGDYGITVEGTLHADASDYPNLPIVFAPAEQAATAGAWRGVVVDGGTSALANVRIERAGNGLAIDGGTHVVSNVTLANAAADNLVVSGDVDATFEWLTLSGAGRHGVTFNATGGDVNLLNSNITGNNRRGVRIIGGHATIEHCHIADNGTGILADGGSTALVTYNTITANRHEGLMLRGAHGIRVNHNNISGNSVESGLVVFDPMASAVLDTTLPYTTNRDTVSAVGASNRLVFANITMANFLGHRLHFRDVADGSEFARVDAERATASHVLDVEERDQRSFEFLISRVSGSSVGSAWCQLAAYRAPATAVELGAFVGAGTFDLRNNYWGVFPDVMSRVVTASAEVDISGFLAAPVDDAGPEN